MSRDPQNDLRYIKTEALIRKTFYLHYETLDELLGKLQTELYMELLESISDLNIPDDLEKIVWALFDFNDKPDSVNEKILYSQGNFPVGKSPGDYARKSLFSIYHSDQTVSKHSEPERNLLASYPNGSIFFIYSQWVADGRVVPLEKVVRFTTDLILSGISGLS